MSAVSAVIKIDHLSQVISLDAVSSSSCQTDCSLASDPLNFRLDPFRPRVVIL